MPLKSFPTDRSLARTSLAAVFVLALVVCFSKPGQSSWLPPCIFFKLTGLYCPGCGSTRMLYSLLHGHALEAFRDNALSMLALPVVLYALVLHSFDLKLPTLHSITAPWSIALTFAVLSFTVARNIPRKPFSNLAPMHPQISPNPLAFPTHPHLAHSCMFLRSL